MSARNRADAKWMLWSGRGIWVRPGPMDAKRRLWAQPANPLLGSGFASRVPFRCTISGCLEVANGREKESVEAEGSCKKAPGSHWRLEK
jgi:hypothetical protein